MCQWRPTNHYGGAVRWELNPDSHGMMFDHFIYSLINLIAWYSRYDKSAVYFGSSGRNGKNFEPWQGLFFSSCSSSSECLFIKLFVYLSICLSTNLSVCLLIYLFVYLSVCLLIYLFVYLSICLSTNLSVCLQIYQFVY